VNDRSIIGLEIGDRSCAVFEG